MHVTLLSRNFVQIKFMLKLPYSAVSSRSSYVKVLFNAHILSESLSV